MDKIKRNELAAEECLRRYQRICPEIVLNDYKSYPKEIKDLNAELKSILELTAVGSSEVHTSNIPNPTQDTAVDKVELAMNIAVVERMQELVEKTLSRLSEEHRERAFLDIMCRIMPILTISAWLKSTENAGVR